MHGDPDDDPHFGDEIVANSVVHLRRSRLFAGAGDEVVTAYAHCFSLRLVPAGIVVGAATMHGDERAIYVIRRGRVRIEQTIAERLTIVTAVLRTTDVFGLEALFYDSPRSSARCVQDSLLLMAPVNRFRSILDRPKISHNVARILAESLDDTSRALENLRYLGLTDAVFAALARIASEYGVAVRDGTLLDVALRPSDLAAIVRSSHADVTQALGLLERSGRIRRSGTSITLLSTHKP